MTTCPKCSAVSGDAWVHANGFAVNVKGDRDAWNERWARDAVAS